MEEDIKKLRDKIDEIDSQLLMLLRERFSTAKEIGKNKKDNNVPIRDIKREKEVLLNIANKAKEQGIKDVKEIKKIFRSIMKSSREIQKDP